MKELAADGQLGTRASEKIAFDTFKIPKHFGRKMILFSEGQQSDGVYVLREGRVKISINSIQGKTLLLRIAHPGELLGLNATLTGKTYRATAETMDGCRIDFISREHLLHLLERDKITYLNVIQSLTGKFTGLIEHTRLLFLSQTAAERLARLLLKWCDEHGQPTADGILIKPGLTHEEIGQLICASRETVTRILNGFKRQGLINLVGGGLLVRDCAKLSEAQNR